MIANPLVQPLVGASHLHVIYHYIFYSSTAYYISVSWSILYTTHQPPSQRYIIYHHILQYIHTRTPTIAHSIVHACECVVANVCVGMPPCRQKDIWVQDFQAEDHSRTVQFPVYTTVTAVERPLDSDRYELIYGYAHYYFAISPTLQYNHQDNATN